MQINQQKKIRCPSCKRRFTIQLLPSCEEAEEQYSPCPIGYCPFCKEQLEEETNSY